MKRMLRTIKPLIFGGAATAAVVVAAMTALWIFDPKADGAQEAKPPVRPVKVITLSKKDCSEQRSFPGLVRARRETNLAFRVGGPLIEMNVIIGQRVARGDLIARIDPRDFHISVKRLEAAIGEAGANLKAMRSGARPEEIRRLEAELNAARARLTEADLNFKRYKVLYEQKAAAKAVYDRTRAAYETAHAGVEAAREALRIGRRGARTEDIAAMEARIEGLRVELRAARNALDDTHLTAPFDGFVHQKPVENYDTVRAGQAIVSLLDFSDVEVQAVIPESLMVRRTAFSGFSCRFNAHPGRTFEAVLKEIGRKTEAANQSYPLTVIPRLPKELDVQPGMAATVIVALRDAAAVTPGINAPISAVFLDAGGDACVWKLNDDLTVRKVPVTVGRMSTDNVRLLSGATAGDRLVAAGARFLREDQRVRLLPTGEERQP